MSSSDHESLHTLGRALLRVSPVSTDRLWAVTHDEPGLDELHRRLKEAVSHPWLRAAIRHAAPSYYARFERWRQSPSSLDTAAAAVAYRYLARACTRATPFGLFGAVGVVEIGEGALEISSEATLRLSFMSTHRAAESSRAGGEADPNAFLVANPTLLFLPDAVRFVAPGGEDGQWLEREANVPDVLAEFLRATRTPTSRSDLMQRLHAVGGEWETLSALLDDLVSAGLLLQWASLPTLMGAPRPRERFVVPWRCDRDAAVERLGTFPTEPRHAVTHARETSVELGQRDVDRVREAVGALRKLGFGAGIDPVLTAFRERFLERFGEGWVPILEATDSRLGVGYFPGVDPGATVQPIPVPPSANRPRPKATTRDLFLARFLSDEASVEVDDVDLEDAVELLGDEHRPFPSSLFCTFSLSDEPDARVWLDAVAGPPGHRTLTRFAVGDAEVLDLARAVAEREEEAGTVLDISHAPRLGVADVLVRPATHDHVVCFFTRDEPPAAVSLDELELGLFRGRLWLRHAGEGILLVPRLTNAHDYSSSTGVPAYRLLATMQSQDAQTALTWSWGGLAGSRTHFPRVVFRGVVLAPRTWRIRRSRLLRRRSGARTGVRWELIPHAKERFSLPRWVRLTRGDRRLVVDLESSLAPEILRKAADRDGLLRLEEVGPSRRSALHSSTGTHAHEFVLPLARAHQYVGKKPPLSDARWHDADEHGRGWATFEVHGDPRRFDELLSALCPELIGPWFFLRYDVPTWHLRLRVRSGSEDEALVSRALFGGRAVEEAGLQWAQRTPYRPEVFRYGGLAMLRLCERHFWRDSQNALERLAHRSGATSTASELLREVLGYVSEWPFDDGQMTEFFAALALDFEKEHGYGVSERRTMGRAFRELDASARFGQVPESTHGSASFSPAFWAKLRELDPWARTTVLRSVLHMFINRRLTSDHRRQETVLYGWLRRVFQGRVARARGATKP